VDLPRYQHTLLDTVPRAYRREILLLLEKIYFLWIGFFRGQGIIAILIGVITWAQLVLMGIPQANVLAVFTAVISLIPTLGGIIALIPLALVPLLQGSTTLQLPNGTVAVAVVGVNFVVSQIIWNGIAPRILGSVVSLPVPVVILGVVIGTAVGGVLGAFLIVPILGSLRLIVLYMLAKIGKRNPFPEIAPEIDVAPTQL
jgi:predicted PurR-regulated permease PerM